MSRSMSHSGHPRLDDAALAAVQKARFKPPSENGQAVSGYAQVAGRLSIGEMT